MTLTQRAMALQEVALCLVRKWWRPAICVGIGASLLMNGVILPFMTHRAPDLTGLAAVIAAAAPFAVARSYEKVMGVADPKLADPS